MKLTKRKVEHIAKLANLELAAEEIASFQKQLSEVLTYVEKLQAVDTNKIQPISQVTKLENVFREDKVQPSLSQQEALSNAPKVYQGYFVVKRIL